MTVYYKGKGIVMAGGFRKGAGRKVIPESEKIKNRNVGMSDEFYNKVMNTEIDDLTKFGEKCRKLMEVGMYALENTKEFYKSCNSIPPLQVSEDSIEYGCQLSILSHPEESSIKLRFIDLFAGIGGIRRGFEDSSTRCVFSSEWDKYAVKTYEANYGETPYGDITKINEKDIPDHDVLLAGFPCQPFSNIGKREGFSHKTQGTLFFDVLRILKEKEPKMFLLENVKGLLTSDKGNTFRVIIESLKDLNYSVFYKVLDAQDFGLPQRRERIVIVGYRSDLEVHDFQFPKGNPEKKVPIRDILESGAKGYSVSKHLQASYLFKKDDGKPQVIDFNSDIQVNTLCATYHKIQRLTGTFIKDGETGLRMFSELELKRLMGFEDDFIIPVSRTQMYRQFGNSVAVPMIKAVANAMKERLIEAEESIDCKMSVANF